MCYILSTINYSVCYVALEVQGGLRGVISPLCGCSSPENFFCIGKHVAFLPHFSCRIDFYDHCWAVFWHMVLSDGFLFLMKELGLLTNLGHWVRVLDVVGSYMYIVL